MDAVQGQSALLLGENQDYAVKTAVPHVRAASRREGTCSAAPVAQKEKCSTQSQGQAESSLCASLRDRRRTLIAENSVSGEEPKTDHEDKISAAPAAQDDKWSTEVLFTAVRGASRREGIAARSKARPLRMEKLKMALVLGDNPGFEFLLECWEDDPALQIVIKKLLAKFKQWGIAIVDGVLVRWEG